MVNNYEGCPVPDSPFIVEEMCRKVAIQGYSGSFHEQAARLFYQGRGCRSANSCNVEIVECATFDGLYEALSAGTADAAVMAIENTVSGGLLPNFELLRKYGRKITGEIFLRISQNLMALPGQKIADIREVRTHYMAINQTRQFFRNYPHIRLVESEDTALSAAQIARENLYGTAAVASSLAADLFGLEILASGIETCHQNFTRFLILDEKLDMEKEEIDKVSLCFTLPHRTGSLAHVLTILSFYDMNLTRIQSLPIPGREWQYFFYVDIRFGNYTRYRQALSAVRPLMEDLMVLGEYVSCQAPANLK